jgi:hypothetical protein
MPRGVRGSVFRPARTHTYPEPAEHAFHSAAYLPGKIDCANLVPCADVRPIWPATVASADRPRS